MSTPSNPLAGAAHGGGPQPSQIQVLPPPVVYSTVGVQPPTPLALTFDDDLLLQIFAPTIATPFTVNLEMRVLYPNGEIKPVRKPIVVNGTSVTLRFNLGLCFVLSAGASLAGGATANRGQVFVQLFVVRNIPTDVLVLWTLLSEYVTTNFRPSWPNGTLRTPLEGNGNLRSIIIAQPGAGTDFAINVPSSVRWRLNALKYTFTTNATAGNRENMLELSDGSHVFFLVPSGIFQPASSAWNYYVARGIQVIAAATTGYRDMPLPDVVLLAGWVITSFTLGLLGTDQYSSIQAQVEEWVDL